jgi:penicillin-binding protein 1A
MPDPTGRLTAGDRLAPAQRRQSGSGRPPRGPGEPPNQPPAGGNGRGGNGRGPNGPRRRRPGRNPFRFIAGFLIGGLYRLALLGLVAVVLVGGGAYFVFSADLPSIAKLKDYNPPLMSRVYADNFSLVAELAQERRIYVPYDQIPHLVSQAFISAEDRNYWIHPGIDPLAIMRAGVVDLTRLGSNVRPLGASTITEQVVKNILLDNRITFARKIKEAILALRVNQAMSKQKILDIYLNEIYLGNNSFGVAAASLAYFDKPLNELDIAEAATLGGLPKAPTSYDPFLHPKASLDRRNWVIHRMEDDGAITAAQANAALAEPLLPKAAHAPATVQDAGYFADAVRADLVARFGETEATEGGLVVRTSLDPKLQEAAVTAVRDGLERYDRRFGYWRGPVRHVDDAGLADDWQKDLAAVAVPAGMRPDWSLAIVLSETADSARLGWIDPQADGTDTGRIGTISLDTIRWARADDHGHPGAAPGRMSAVMTPGDVVMVEPQADRTRLDLEQIPRIEGALIAMDPRTGRVLALVGGWSHNMSPFDRAISAQRQPGSSVKPFDYLTAMEQNIQPDAPVLDAPFVQQMSDGTVYRPGNYEEEFQGPVPIFYALEQSLNLATLHLAREVGLENIARNFQAFGIVDQMPMYYPSAIGAIDTTLLRMVTGYAELDDYGRQVTPSLIDSVTNPDGRVLYQAKSQTCANCDSGSPDQPPVLTEEGDMLADPASVFQDITMMRGVVAHGTGVPAMQGISVPVAGKTGTTNDFNDAWFIGFTPDMVTGCWTGYDTPHSLGNNETGGNVCGPIWNEFMKVALAKMPPVDFPVPQGVTLQPVTFKDVTENEAFKTGQSPGAQANDTLLAGQNSDQLSPGQPAASGPAAAVIGQPDATINPTGAATPAGGASPGVDKSLGGLY